MPVPVTPDAAPFAHAGGDVGVLLVHGFTGSPHSLRPWGDHLAAAGLTVSCPRLPGHGTRWQDLNRTRWPEWYGEVERAFDDLRQRCEPVFVMGLSMGATLALKLAAERDEQVAGLVLVNPSLFTLRRDAKLLPLIAPFWPSIRAIGSDIKAPGGNELAYGRTPLRAAASLARLWRVVRPLLPSVTQPLLLFHSAEDHVVEPANSVALLAEVGSADVREVELADSYHVATLDNDRERIFADSLAFIRELAGVGADGHG